jgi:tetratricopeptide (TPR) repeat protein
LADHLDELAVELHSSFYLMWGLNLYHEGRHQKALQAGMQGLEFAHGDLDLEPLFQELVGLSNHRLGQLTEAMPYLRRALAIRQSTLIPSHPAILSSLNNLAVLHYHLHDYSEAEGCFRQVLAIIRTESGDVHLDTAEALNNLATLQVLQGRYAEAQPLLQHALAFREKELEQEDPLTADSLNNLAYLYLQQGRVDDAEPMLRRAVMIHKKTLGLDAFSTAISMSNLASVYRSQGRDEPLLLSDRRIPLEVHAYYPTDAPGDEIDVQDTATVIAKYVFVIICKFRPDSPLLRGVPRVIVQRGNVPPQ